MEYNFVIKQDTINKKNLTVTCLEAKHRTESCDLEIRLRLCNKGKFYYPLRLCVHITPKSNIDIYM